MREGCAKKVYKAPWPTMFALLEVGGRLLCSKSSLVVREGTGPDLFASGSAQIQACSLTIAATHIRIVGKIAHIRMVPNAREIGFPVCQPRYGLSCLIEGQ